jgi:hypothetical protein
MPLENYGKYKETAEIILPQSVRLQTNLLAYDFRGRKTGRQRHTDAAAAFRQRIQQMVGGDRTRRRLQR